MAHNVDIHTIAACLRRARIQVCDLGRLAEQLAVETVPADCDIIRQGEKGDFLYVILAGEVSVSVEELDNAEVARLGDGDVFGEMAVVAREPRAATVRTTRRCELVRIDAQCAEEMFASNRRTREYLGHMSVTRTEQNLARLVDDDHLTAEAAA